MSVNLKNSLKLLFIIEIVNNQSQTFNRIYLRTKDINICEEVI